MVIFTHQQKFGYVFFSFFSTRSSNQENEHPKEKSK
jgi:hypothetical protein